MTTDPNVEAVTSDRDRRIIDATSIALEGRIGCDDDVKRLRQQVSGGLSLDPLNTACEIAVAFIRWCQDLKALSPSSAPGGQGQVATPPAAKAAKDKLQTLVDWLYEDNSDSLPIDQIKSDLMAAGIDMDKATFRMNQLIKNCQAAKNTDRELWREREGDYYADSIHVTAGGAIGMNCGGMVIVKPLREWHALCAPLQPAAQQPEPPASEQLPMIEGEIPVVQRTRDYGHGDPQGWYITDENWELELRRDGKWHSGFDKQVFPTRQAAVEFIKATAAKEGEPPADGRDAERSSSEWWDLPHGELAAISRAQHNTIIDMCGILREACPLGTPTEIARAVVDELTTLRRDLAAENRRPRERVPKVTVANGMRLSPGQYELRRDGETCGYVNVGFNQPASPEGA